MLIHPIAVNVIVRSKSAKMINLNENELFLYRIMVFYYFEIVTGTTVVETSVTAVWKRW